VDRMQLVQEHGLVTGSGEHDIEPNIDNFSSCLSTVCLPRITLPCGVSYLPLNVTSQ
jgi:hypothetical protein